MATRHQYDPDHAITNYRYGADVYGTGANALAYIPAAEFVTAYGSTNLNHLFGFQVVVNFININATAASTFEEVNLISSTTTNTTDIFYCPASSTLTLSDLQLKVTADDLSGGTLTTNASYGYRVTNGGSTGAGCSASVTHNTFKKDADWLAGWNSYWGINISGDTAAEYETIVTPTTGKEFFMTRVIVHGDNTTNQLGIATAADGTGFLPVFEPVGTGTANLLDVKLPNAFKVPEDIYLICKSAGASGKYINAYVEGYWA